MEGSLLLVLLIGAIWAIVKLSGRNGDVIGGKNNAPNRSGRRRTKPHRPPARAKKSPPTFRPNPNHRSKAKPKTAIGGPGANLILPPIPPSMILSGAAYVIDGDTIRIKKTKIRLAGIDAPELDMPWGQKSKWAMVAICKGLTIRAHFDGERSYDRLVATCYLPDGRDIGAELIKTGLALDLPHFSQGKYRHLEPADARRRLANGKFGHRSRH